VAPAGFGQVLPPLIFEFLGSANSTIVLPLPLPLVMAGLDPAIHLTKMDECADQVRA
jgi:hypothetical protein